MVRINSLSMKGFKSFNVKTNIKLSHNLTSVVGPNGSGKSNILDAVCFVLGRLSFSSMRASRGSDLIYSPKGKKGADYAKVRMVLDNSDGLLGESKQITISRKVHRDGTGTYRINGKRSTRTKLLDLLAQALVFPDGHNIVQQGDIVSFIKCNAEERREEIDTIAGIEAYEEKKRKSERELESVLQKISQVSLLIKERKRRLERLEKERRRARSYQELLERRERIEASILARRMEERSKFIQDFEGQFKSRKAELERAEKVIEESEKKLVRLEEEKKELERRLASDELKEKLEAARELEGLRHRVESRRKEVGEAEESLERMEKRVAQLSESKTQIGEAVSKAEKELEALKEKRGKAEEEVEKLEAEREGILESVNQAKEKRRALEEKRGELREEIDKKKDERRELLRKRDRFEDIAAQREEERERTEKRLEEMEEARQESFQERKRAEERLRALESELGELRSTKSRVSSRKSDLEGRLEDGRVALRELEDRHLAIQAKDGMTAMAERLLEKREEFNIEGRVRDLFEAGEEDLPLLRVAAGPNLNAFVVEDEPSALAAISFLHKNRLGRARFIPLSENDSPLLSRVDCDQRHRGAIATAFGGFDIGEFGDGRVTRDGTLKMGNVIVGGYDEYDVRALKTLEEKVSGLEEERSALEKELSQLSENVSELEVEKASLESRLESKAFDAEVAEELGRSLEKLEKERDEALKGKEKVEKRLPSLEGELEKLKEELSSMEEAAAVDFVALSEVDEKLKGARERLNDANLSFNTMEGRLKNVILPDEKNVRGVLKETLSAKKETENVLPSLKGELERLEKELKEREASLERAAKEVGGLKARRKEATAREGELREAKARAEGSIGRLKVEVEDFEEQIGMQKREFEELEEELAKFGDVDVMSGSIVKLKDGLAKVERRISTFGAVNMTAQDEFEEAEGKFAEVEEKARKLEAEKKSIEEFMEEVETRKREAFMENFEKISQYFSEIFERLAGGKGELLLESEEDPFAGGLIIQASPGGKQLFRMESMSGGEKTLTALAFVFAIQKHKPAPFYVFDEVEAALDKKNSEKVADLLKEMSGRAQIIMITHNDAVMRVSDQLIGVSMASGVSRIVSAQPEKLLEKRK